MSQVVQEHRASAPDRVGCAVITVSDTRTAATDTGGDLLVRLLTEAGFEIVSRHLIPDEPATMRPLLESLITDANVDAVLLTGGTGLSSRDQTYETVSSLITKPIPGYGELLRMLSYQEIGPAAMLSRALAGLAGRTVIAAMPGSPAAVQLAVERILGPELRHLVREARR